MNIIINTTNKEVKYPKDYLILDYSTCMTSFDNEMMDHDYILNPDTLSLAKIVIDDVDINDDNWKTMGNGISHLISRIDMTMKHDSKVVWRLPESGLYPKYQVNIANLIIEMGFFDRILNNFLTCETHSEYFIRRLQVCIAYKKLDPSVVNISHIDLDKDGNGSIKAMEIDKRGFFKEECPDGFFDVSSKSVMKLWESQKKERIE